MKKLLVHIIFAVTCLYFISAGNPSFFSKLGKSIVAENMDLDEDAPDEEAKDSKEKEDKCDEENFFASEDILSFMGHNESFEIAFPEKSFFIPNPIAEKTSPPPKA